MKPVRAKKKNHLTLSEAIPEWGYAVSRSLLKALHERDPYTHSHCIRVGLYARKLAEAAGLSHEEVRSIEFAGTFHDIGKIGIPDHILLKPARLTEEEAAIMRSHPIKSVEILQPLAHIPFFAETLPGIRHHHERVDGRGYPDGLKGDEIPLAARFILVVDTFDAMTTSRVYRQGLPIQEAYDEIARCAGTQFDSKLAELFVASHPSWGSIAESISQEFVIPVTPEKKKAA